MAIQLDRVVPFGRSLDEYIHLFNLSDRDFQKSILGIGDGPASFNAEGTARGYSIHSIDPIYIFSAKQIQQRVLAVVDPIIDQIKATPDDWVWNYHRSPDDLKQHRLQVAARFCADFEQGKAEHRYTPGELPHLNIQDGQSSWAYAPTFCFCIPIAWTPTFTCDRSPNSCASAKNSASSPSSLSPSTPLPTSSPSWKPSPLTAIAAPSNPSATNSKKAATKC